MFLTAWGTAGNDNGQFNGPLGVGVDADRNVYVADTNKGLPRVGVTGWFRRRLPSEGS